MDKRQATQILHSLIELNKEGAQVPPTHVFSALLRAGAELEEENEWGETALYAAIATDMPDRILRLLLKNRAATEREMYLGDGNTGTAIMYAIKHASDTEWCVRRLIKGGANPDYANRYRETPCMLAAYKGELGVCKILVKAGANPKRINKEGDDALRYAIDGMIDRSASSHDVSCLYSDPNYALVDYLIEQGCDINRRDRVCGKTALMNAALHGSAYKIVDMLLKRGANPNIQNKAGKTALMYAAERNEDPRMVQDLIQAGADPDIIDRDEHSALWYATQNKNPNVALTLLSELKKTPRADQERNCTRG